MANLVVDAKGLACPMPIVKAKKKGSIRWNPDKLWSCKRRIKAR